MSISPVISIIIPVYNVEQWLCRCVKSLQAQTFTDFEAILIDDGSTDNSGKICDEIASEDSRFQVIHQKNQGAAVARNLGLDIAEGKYLTFVDADDFLSSETFEENINLLQEDPSIDILRFPLFSYHDENHIVRIGCNSNLDVLENDKIMHLWAVDMDRIGVYNGGAFFLREKIGKIRFKNIKFNEDRFFMTEALLQAEHILLSDKGKYFYNQSNTSSVCHTKQTLQEKKDALTFNLFLVDVYKLRPIEERISVCLYTRNDIYAGIKEFGISSFYEECKDLDLNMHLELCGILHYSGKWTQKLSLLICHLFGFSFMIRVLSCMR